MQLVSQPAVLEDLLGELVWPKLLRAGGLALRPERVGFGLAIVVLVGLIERIGSLWHDEEGEAFVGFLSSVLGNVGFAYERTMGSSVWDWLFEGPRMLFAAMMSAPGIWWRDYPLSMFVLGLPCLWVWVVFGGAISRSAMSEVSLSRVPAWPRVLGESLRRWPSLFGVMVVPLAGVAFLWLMLAVGGLLLHVPVLDVIGAALFGVGLVLSLLATLVLIAYVLGSWMLVPSVMAEGTDALDGVQRGIAYVWGRPLRTILYLAVLVVAGMVVVGVFGWVADRTMEFASWGVREWAPEGSASVFGIDPEGTDSVARGVLDFWGTVVTLLVMAYVVSYVHTAGAMLYLCLRRVCDGQEIAELWESEGEGG